MSTLGSKNLVAFWRGLEAAILAGLAYLGTSYLELDEHTGSGVVDLIESHGDKALGVAIVTLILGFGLTRGPIRNVSKVAPEAPAGEVELEEEVEG